MKMNGKLLLALAMGVVPAMGVTYQAYAAILMAKVALKPTPLAQNAGLQNASGQAELGIEKGDVQIVVTLPAGTRVPEGSVLEGWLVSAGTRGGPGMAHASAADQKYGPAFGNPEFAKLSRELPLSTGKFKRTDARTLVNKFHIDNTLPPYGAAVATLESDGNQGAYDPRPGTPILAGEISAP